MAQPPDAATAAVPPPVIIDRDVWYACAVPYSGRLPNVGSLVYYFPQGHIEQCAMDPAQLLYHLPDCIYPVPCTVADVVLNVDAESAETYATITLLPGSHDNIITRRQVPAHGEPGFRFFEKQLSPDDVRSNALVLPAGAEHVLPPLDLAAYQTAELIDVKDLRGKRFEFDYTWNRRRRCHMLGDLGFKDNDGWRGFVKAKRLATGDTVVFMRRPGGGDGELLVGVRRSPHGRYSRPGVEHNKVVNAVWQAMVGGAAFEATYYPRQGTWEFVVWRNEVVDFLAFYPFAPGTKVSLRMNPLQQRFGHQSISGTVRSFDHQRTWRMLEVDWDHAASPISYTIHRQVSHWQVLRQTAAATWPVRTRDAIATTSAAASLAPQVQTRMAPVIDNDIWLACATPYSGRLPLVGSVVYYFPKGHAEQCHTCTTYMLPANLHRFPCTVIGIDFAVDTQSDDSYAIIYLLPGEHYVPHRPLAAHVLVRGQREFCFFDKKLSQSDVAANGGALIVIPKSSAAEHVLPPIPDLRVMDLQGGRWEFGHTWSDTDTDRSHTLAAGWSTFVKAKRLCVGDTVIFMRRPGGELLVGVRRKPYGGMPVGIPADHVAGAGFYATLGHPFRVTYCPWQGTAEFVVRREEVEGSSLISLTPGTRVRLLMNPDDTRRHTQPVYGTVRDVDTRRAWRILEVEWDRASPLSSTMNRRVNPWQVQPVQLAPQSCDEEAATTSTAHAGDATTSAPSSANVTRDVSSSSFTPIIPGRGSAFRIVNPQDGSQANNSASHQ